MSTILRHLWLSVAAGNRLVACPEPSLRYRRSFVEFDAVAIRRFLPHLAVDALFIDAPL